VGIWAGVSVTLWSLLLLLCRCRGCCVAVTLWLPSLRVDIRGEVESREGEEMEERDEHEDAGDQLM
jgi:hypothetical protein